MKYLGSILAAAILSFHALMTAVYLSPPNLLKAAVGPTSAQYMNRFFYQNWHLFSPNPGIATTRLWVRCQIDGQWSGWAEPMEKIQDEYYGNRFSGKGKVLYVYNGIPMLLAKAFDQAQDACLQKGGGRCPDNEVRQMLKSTDRYLLAQRYAKSVCELEGAKDGSFSYQFKIMTFEPMKYSERAQGEKWSSVKETVFDVERGS